MNTNKNIVTLAFKTPDGGVSRARVSLLQGGRLIDLKFLGIDIFAELDPSTYQDTYPSSILFPFANRIRNGEYTYNNRKYRLHCNEKENNNALHGLVFNKPFECIHKESLPEYTSVTLRYRYDGQSEGFPYPFAIELTYQLNHDSINLSVKVENNGLEAFPFTLGWHPYFNTKNLFDSYLDFKSKKQVVLDLQKIPIKVEDFDVEMPFQIKDDRFDDAYFLESNLIKFMTPEYDLDIICSSESNFLQIYTPKLPNVIALEPMTGIADSFNNNVGLQILKPKNIYEVEWTVIVYFK